MIFEIINQISTLFSFHSILFITSKSYWDSQRGIELEVANTSQYDRIALFSGKNSVEVFRGWAQKKQEAVSRNQYCSMTVSLIHKNKHCFHTTFSSSHSLWRTIVSPYPECILEESYQMHILWHYSFGISMDSALK